jgi:hypothetical protein
MKPSKIFIVFIFLLAFALNVSAQPPMPKVVWKNLREKYEKFEDVNPVIVNENAEPIFMCASVKFGIIHRYFKLFRFFEASGNWNDILHHGHPSDKKYEEKIMSNFKIEPRQARPLFFDAEDWMLLTEDELFPPGFRYNPDYKGKGKYKFTLRFYVGEKKSRKMFVTESPVFEITKDQKKDFDK